MIVKQPGSILCTAVAGSGKTYMLENGVKAAVIGKHSKGSDEQEAIWAEIKKGRRPEKVRVLAFNTMAADQLKTRLPQHPGIEVMTTYSFGYKQIAMNTKGKVQVEFFKIQRLLEHITGLDIKQMDWKQVKAVEDVLTMLRLNLYTATEEEIDYVIEYYGVECEENLRPWLYEVVPLLMGLMLADRNNIDFTDMVWMPAVLPELAPRAVDQTYIDESQDLSAAQRYLAIRSGRRVFCVGDPHQAIYGFAGADTQAWSLTEQMLASRSEGLQQFPMTYTRRCGTEIVALAQTLVPDIEALPGAHKGEVRLGYHESTLTQAELDPNDLVLCRTNAPLIRQALFRMRQRQRVRIAGKRYGDSMIKEIKSYRTHSITHLRGLLVETIQEKEEQFERRKWVSPDQKAAVLDKFRTLLYLANQANSVDEVVAIVEAVFSDKPSEGEILFSSIHAAKGLERKRVHFMRENWKIHPKCVDRQQEDNLKYVGYTRAEQQLTCYKVPEKGDDDMMDF